MSHERFVRALVILRPGAPFSAPIVDAPTLADVEWGDGVTVPTQEELEAALLRVDKEDASTVINRQRDAKLLVGVEWNGKRWHTDETFQGQLTSRISAWNAGIIAPGETKPVRARDNTVNWLTFEQHKALAAVLIPYVEGVWAQSWVEKDAL